jgi:hypothetical protein
MQSSIDGPFLRMILHNQSQHLIYVSIFEVYSQSEMPLEDSEKYLFWPKKLRIDRISMQLACRRDGLGEKTVRLQE